MDLRCAKSGLPSAPEAHVVAFKFGREGGELLWHQVGEPMSRNDGAELVLGEPRYIYIVLWAAVLIVDFADR